VRSLLACGSASFLSALCRRVRAAGFTVEVCEAADQAIAQAAAQPSHWLLLAGDSSLSPAFEQLTAELARRTMLVLGCPTEPLLTQLAGREPLATLFVHPGEPNADDLLGAVLRHLKREPFGLNLHLSPQTEVRRVTLSDSAMRGEVIDALDQHLGEMGLDPRLLGQLLTVVDEFTTNAFYNAPVDEAGRHQFAHLSRIEPITLPADRPVEISWGCDGRRAVLSVRDHYGSLDRATLMTHIGKALGEAKVSFSTGGAGLGLVTAFNAASQLIFNISPGQTTEAIGLVDIVSYREFLEHGRAFQIFYAHPSRSGPHE
jgi:hypothetical protein